MAFADPITVTINAVAKTLVKINQDKYSSEYFRRETDREFTLRIQQKSINSNGRKLDRHSVELTETIYPTEALPEGIFRKSYVVIDNLRTDAGTDLGKTVVGLMGFITEANVAKLVNYES